MSFSALLHSVSYSGSWGQAHLSLDAFIDKAADLGYEGVMLMAKRPHLSLLDYGPKERAQLRQHLEKRKLRDLCIAGYNNFSGDLEHGEVPQREIQVHYITDLARLAHDLGGNLVRIFTAYENPVAGYTAQWNLVVTALKECARRAAEFGVTLGVQNHHDTAAHYESLFDLLQEINEPNCQAMFDAWAPALHGSDLVAAVKKMAPYIVHTTVADYVRRPRFRYLPNLVNYARVDDVVRAVPMGEGFIDYRGFLRALREAGYQGHVAYEMCSPLRGGGSEENLDRCARRFLQFMNEWDPS